MGKIANRQSLVFSERNQLSQAIPQPHVERSQRMPIARFESQRNERRVYEDLILFFLGEICPPTNASDSNRSNNSRYSASAITIARFAHLRGIPKSAGRGAGKNGGAGQSAACLTLRFFFGHF